MVQQQFSREFRAQLKARRRQHWRDVEAAAINVGRDYLEGEQDSRVRYTREQVVSGLKLDVDQVGHFREGYADQEVALMQEFGHIWFVSYFAVERPVSPLFRDRARAARGRVPTYSRVLVRPVFSIGTLRALCRTPIIWTRTDVVTVLSNDRHTVAQHQDRLRGWTGGDASRHLLPLTLSRRLRLYHDRDAAVDYANHFASRDPDNREVRLSWEWPVRPAPPPKDEDDLDWLNLEMRGDTPS